MIVQIKTNTLCIHLKKEREREMLHNQDLILLKVYEIEIYFSTKLNKESKSISLFFLFKNIRNLQTYLKDAIIKENFILLSAIFRNF